MELEVIMEKIHKEKWDLMSKTNSGPRSLGDGQEASSGTNQLN